MTTEELQIELKRVLPVQHPFIRCFEEHVGLIGEHQANEAAKALHDEYVEQVDHEQILNRLVRTLEDWRRGIRDWDEVESELIDVQNQEWICN